MTGQKGHLYGGKSVILFGDPAQLQPIGRHIWTNKHFLPFQVAVLRESKRQNEPQFIGLLNRMRINQLTDEDWEVLRSRLITMQQLDEMNLDRGRVLFPTNANRQHYNESVLKRMPGKQHTFLAHVGLNFPAFYLMLTYSSICRISNQI